MKELEGEGATFWEMNAAAEIRRLRELSEKLRYPMSADDSLT